MTEETELEEILLPNDLDYAIYKSIMEGRFDDEESLILTAIEELLFLELINPEQVKSKDHN